MFSGFQFGKFFKHLRRRVVDHVSSPQGQGEIFRHVRDVGVGVIAVYTMFTYGYNLTLCKGPSMEPTLNSEGSLVLVDVFSY
eukprot:gene44979-55020_t